MSTDVNAWRTTLEVFTPLALRVQQLRAQGKSFDEALQIAESEETHEEVSA